MRVFVAGATGLIGSRATRLMLDAGHHVSAIARSEEACEPLREAGADMAVCNVYDAEMLRGAMAFAKPDVVMHQLTALPDRLDAPDASERFAANDRIRIEGTR